MGSLAVNDSSPSIPTPGRDSDLAWTPAADASSDAGTVPSSSSPCTKTSSHAHVASREQPNVRPS